VFKEIRKQQQKSVEAILKKFKARDEMTEEEVAQDSADNVQNEFLYRD